MYKLGQTGAGELKDIYIRLEIRSPNRGGGLISVIWFNSVCGKTVSSIFKRKEWLKRLQRWKSNHMVRDSREKALTEEEWWMMQES